MTSWGMRAVRGVLVLLPLTLAACQTLIRPHGPDECGPDGCPAVAAPRLHHEPTMHALACDLDHLEKHIDWYGSVVAKVPDVWGQARLTQYREEFERVMAADLDAFKENLQGSLARADQSFFQQSVALSAAVSGGVATTRIPRGVSGTAATAPQTTAQQVLVSPAAISDTTLPGIVTDTEGNAAFFKDVTLPRVKYEALRGTGNDAALAIGLEPTLYLAQKKRYLDFLNQLRRENEGDDTADSPGYSLNLVRLPVSVLPGKRTDQGHGAEVTFTLTPILGDDLLPTTFRNLVANDLRQQLGFQIAQILGTKDIIGLLNDDVKQVIEGMALLRQWAAAPALPADFTKIVEAMTDADKDRLRKAVLSLEWIGDECTEQPELDFGRCIANAELPGKVAEVVKALRHQRQLCGFGCNQPPTDPADLAPSKKGTPNQRSYTKLSTSNPVARMAAAKRIRLQAAINVPSLSFSNGLDNKLAFPPSQIYDVIGEGFAFEIAFGVWEALRNSIDRQGYAHLPDVQSYLREEVRAAQQFLAVPANQHLWDRFCTPELVTAIRSRQVARIQDLREEFRCEVERLTLTDQFRRSRPENELLQFSKTAALAWCVIVDSALLTDRLVRDMKNVASARGRGVCQETWLPYYLPEPPPEARQAFNDYVKLRWPVHVFALDPATQDQNLADSLLTRRETQLALSMAFTSGQINARTLTRYARRLEAQYDTIALNRTQVGFAHGENTFGWRFYPRFQTPDTESNLTTLVRDQIVGGPSRNALLRQRRLEPGPRECVAIVMMPSFVPYMTIDSVSNWFGLANPKHKVLDHTQALRMSRAVQTLKTGGPNVGDACDYREGEFERLLRRAEQLEARLPTQTQVVPVPILNTLGGFEMFSNGTTDLAPELYGFYGAPGADTRKATTLFLVGDHFSPLRTRVIVGNKAVAKDSPGTRLTMISRQVVQVDFGPEMIPLNATHVTVHVATPYGVSRELLVPVVNTSATQPDGYYLTPESGAAFRYTMTQQDKRLAIRLQASADQKVAVRAVFASGVVPPKARLVFSIPGADPVGSEALSVDAYGTYTLEGEKLKTVLETLIAKRLPPNTLYETQEQIVQRFPQVIDVRILPEGPTGVLTPVSGILRAGFSGALVKPPVAAPPPKPATDPKKSPEPQSASPSPPAAPKLASSPPVQPAAAAPLPAVVLPQPAPIPAPLAPPLAPPRVERE